MIYIFGWAFDPPHAGHAAIVRAILYKKHPEKIVIIPSSERDDKRYKTTDEHRLKMLDIFVRDIRDPRVVVDDYFVKNWHGEMITRDVDEYARKTYGENIVHIFGTDTIASMPDWDSEHYAAEKIAKLFIPRGGFLEDEKLKKEYVWKWCRFSPAIIQKNPPDKGGRGVQFISYNPKLTQLARENRKNMNSAEWKMWNILNRENMWYKFTRQKPLADYIVDFYCSKLCLVIEVDGDSHLEQQEYDAERTECLNKQWLHVLRYTNKEVIENTEWVYQDLQKRIEKLSKPLPASPCQGRSIKNYEILSDSHFPDISSTQIRAIIPEYTHISRLYDDHLKTFKIPGLSNKISLYILENRLYRSHLPKEKLLVHVCCGPDVVMPILQLKDEYDLICFWYDPNIQPKSEHDKRYEAFKKVCEIENIPFIKGAYDVKNFFARIKGYEFTPEKTGEKCTRCYDMRMFVAAKLAKKLGIPNYTTSLNTSPKKDLEKMFFMGHKYADRYGIKFLDIPFRKRGGFEISTEYTKEHDIYRQNYCGCVYSIREGGDSEMKRRMVG